MAACVRAAGRGEPRRVHPGGARHGEGGQGILRGPQAGLQHGPLRRHRHDRRDHHPVEGKLKLIDDCIGQRSHTHQNRWCQLDFPDFLVDEASDGPLVLGVVRHLCDHPVYSE